jgi:hypothetical protein
MIIRALLIWVILLVLATANGIFRESVLNPRMSEAAAHAFSSVLLCAIIVAVSLWTAPWLRISSVNQAFQVGLAWLALTLVFEFGFGRLRGRTWSELLVDYAILRGRIWVLVLVTIALAPLIAAKVRGLRRSDH